MHASQQAPAGALRRALLNTAAIAALGMTALPAAHAQSWVLFDDFTATSLNVNKWLGGEGSQYGGIRLESQRVVTGGQLRLYSRGFGDSQRNSGQSWVRNEVVFAKSAAITAMKSTITMRNAGGTTCAGNPNPDATVWRARLFGFFFNGGTPVAGAFMNDVFAGVQVFRTGGSTDPAGTFKISGFVGQCLDNSCIGTTGLGAVDLGTVTLNTPVALSVVWNKASKNFTFQRDTNATLAVPYSVSDAAGPEGSNAKRMEVTNFMAQCTAGRVGAATTADFDNVFTNPLPAIAGVPVVPQSMMVDDAIGPGN